MNTAQTDTTAPAAPAVSNEVILGSIGCRLLAHAEQDGLYFLQARDLRFYSPRIENLQAALDLLGIDVNVLPGVVVGGMFAGIPLTSEQVSSGNAVAKMLLAAVEAWKLAQAAKLAAATVAEA